MNTFWDYFWPLLVAGLVIGLLAGLRAFPFPKGKSKEDLAGDPTLRAAYKKKRLTALAIGVGVVIATAAIWHGPLGAADRFVAQVQSNIRLSVTSWEMPQVSGQLHHAPLTRHVHLSGQADDFQRGQLVGIIETVPGVSSAGWSDGGAGLPLIAEAAIACLLGFLFGLLLAYLVELHRRYNSQWNW